MLLADNAKFRVTLTRSVRLAIPTVTWKVEKGNSQHPVLYQSASSNKEAEGPNCTPAATLNRRR